MTTITRTTTTVTRTTAAVPAHERRSSSGWLKALGFLLVALGILGLIGFLVDTAHDYAFHIEGGQMLFHWLLGVACLVAGFALRRDLWTGIATIVAGAILLAAGLLGFALASWHAGVVDGIIHLLLGLVTVLVGIGAVNRSRDYERRHRGHVHGTA